MKNQTQLTQSVYQVKALHGAATLRWRPAAPAATWPQIFALLRGQTNCEIEMANDETADQLLTPALIFREKHVN